MSYEKSDMTSKIRKMTHSKDSLIASLPTTTNTSNFLKQLSPWPSTKVRIGIAVIIIHPQQHADLQQSLRSCGVR
ncbi:unnamed protein product [Brugia pahangi]|uniref:Ovule protein n=1 Tax=Brugia pahangi TaxID=6280 RepID=A0A0N4T2H4_BRUPA|nr:unnamed protein product [Brugia pahangi]